MASKTMNWRAQQKETVWLKWILFSSSNQPNCSVLQFRYTPNEVCLHLITRTNLTKAVWFCSTQSCVLYVGPSAPGLVWMYKDCSQLWKPVQAAPHQKWPHKVLFCCLSSTVLHRVQGQSRTGQHPACKVWDNHSIYVGCTSKMCPYSSIL